MFKNESVEFKTRIIFAYGVLYDRLMTKVKLNMSYVQLKPIDCAAVAVYMAQCVFELVKRLTLT
jgi:hypothetical protein